MPGRSSRVASITTAMSTAAPTVVVAQADVVGELALDDRAERVERAEDHGEHREHAAPDLAPATRSCAIVVKLDSAPR